MKGANARRADRLKRQSNLVQKAKIEVGHVSKVELWLIGIALIGPRARRKRNTIPAVERVSQIQTRR